MEEKKSSHISYKEYQKQVTKTPNEGIAIFVSAFFILLLLFLGIAKQISPDVDVTIGNNDSSDSETVGIEKNEVDERLKLLQMEDSTGNEMFSPELDEKVVIPEQKEELAEKEASPKPAETASPEPKAVQAPIAQPTTVSKVVVGFYQTKEQADVARGIIAEETGLNISPFVRAIGGGYTIQVGSYSTRDKAQSLVNDLLRNNYPARIITE